MAEFGAKDVKALRDATGAGMMDAKRALEANDGDMEAAKQWLREKGLAASAKRDERENTQGESPPNVERVGSEGLRRIGHQPPGDLQEEKPDGQLDTAHERARKRPGEDVEDSEPSGEQEHCAHEQGAGGDLVGPEALGDRDGAEGLQRLDRDRQLVDERGRHIEEPGRKEYSGGGEAVRDDQRHRDRDEDS